MINALNNPESEAKGENEPPYEKNIKSFRAQLLANTQADVYNKLIMAATKSIVADLNKGEKLNEKNYDVWHRKIQYILKEQDMLETIIQSVIEPEPGNITQHKCDHEAFQDWKRKDRVARILILSSMRDDIMLHFESKLQWPPQPPLHSLNSLHQAFTLTTTHHHNPLSPRRLSLNLSSSSSSSSLTSTITFSLLTPTNKLHRFIILLLRRACRHLAAADYRKGRRRNRRLSIALAGDSAKKRGYVFFCRASKFIDPSDLRAIDSLWLAHSDGKFGYSVQKRVWEKKARRDFTRFFIRVGWMKKLDTEVEQWNYRSFPTEFTWELRDDTPEGHLPLTNALRGTQLLASIFTHPAFAEEGEEEEGEESDGEEMKKEKPKLMGGNRTLKTDYSF
ncbi:uncharacterized protein A4U43_C09F4710 [Asparagus officinalis]|uniref:Uncharacterized protein n=1 Tax=Asparagus officinalis TaxID=4686 RepID=A0A5P1E5K7_ASPOF|nr:uncharacterized protein A4U43_C09F4710 [Asparagus officinalis]